MAVRWRPDEPSHDLSIKWQKVGLAGHAASEMNVLIRQQSPMMILAVLFSDLEMMGSLAVVANKRPRWNLGARALRAPTSNHSREGGMHYGRMSRPTWSGRVRTRDDWEGMGWSLFSSLRNEELLLKVSWLDFTWVEGERLMSLVIKASILRWA